MSVKIKISYKSQKELLEVIKRLRPMVQSYKVSYAVSIPHRI